MVEAALIKGFVERRGREVWQFGRLGVKRSGCFPAKISFRIKVPTSRKGREKWGTGEDASWWSHGEKMCKLVTWR
jgi:hypothetical protein